MSTSTSTSQTDSAPRSKSISQIVWEQFRKHRLAMLGVFVLIALYIGAIFAGFISPYGLNEFSTSDIRKFAPPTKIHIRDPETGAISWPFVYASNRKIDLENFQTIYEEDRSQKYYIKLFVQRPEAKYKFLGFIETDIHLFGVDSPAKIYLLGADSFGRDIFSRVWYGAQISLTIGIAALAISFPLGLLFGGMAGYFGGRIDNLIMRVTEAMSAIPTIFLLITLTAFISSDVNPIVVFYGITLILGIIGWGGLARIVRSQFLALRDAEFVQAATALGASPARIIWRHMLPSVATYLIISATLAIPGAILSESGLSFIGKGIREPYSSWGFTLAQAQDGGLSSITDRPWVLVPGFLIVLTMLCWSFVGDGLRDAFDPKKRQ